MHRGYIKVWRKTVDSGILKNHKLWAFWSWCLLKASHKDTTVIVGFQEVNLQSGQFIFGRKNAAFETGLTQQEVRTCLKNLEKMKNLTINPTNKYSIVSITKWDIYQQDTIENNQQINQQLTNKEPTTNQQLTTNKNDKNEKNEKKKEKIDKKENLFFYLKSQIEEKQLTPFKNKLIEFCNYRKKINKPYKTEYGINGLIADALNCMELSLDINQCIDKAMSMNWQRFFYEDFREKNNGNKSEVITSSRYHEKTDAELDLEIERLMGNI